jgi:NDP-sugar pyrophosphorylase family protein
MLRQVSNQVPISANEMFFNFDSVVRFKRRHELGWQREIIYVYSGSLGLSGNAVTGFQEKPPGDGSWINGGFFVLSPRVIDYIDGDNTSWESTPMETLARNGELQAFEHTRQHLAHSHRIGAWLRFA